MSKTAAVVLAFLSLIAFTTASRAQLLPSGNVYVGAAYADNVDVVNRLTFRGFDGSLEDFALRRFSYLSFVLDGSGFFRQGVQQYNLLLGPQVSMHYGKWRPFVHLMGGIQRNASGGTTKYPVEEDIGAGVDRKFQLLFFKKFSWRLQFDYSRTHFLSATQNDFRGSAGIVWHFGGFAPGK
ncbi:MAG: hypothetical protein WA416_08280 [Candidatus Sulfotelmatobacter sp.]